MAEAPPRDPGISAPADGINATAAPGASGLSRRKVSVRWSALVLGGMVVVLVDVLLIGVFLPDIDYLGYAGSFIIPAAPLWFAILAVIGGALTLFAWPLGLRRSGLALVALALFAVIGSGIVTARMTRVAERNGADIDLLATLNLASYGASARPDETVAYSAYRGEDLKLDIYRPPSAARHSGRAAPILVYVHGGGWISDDRTSQSANMRWFADHGWLVVSVDYTLATEGTPTWNVAQPEVGCALTWVVKHADRLNANVSRLSMLGDSAGGNLAINTAYSAARGKAKSSCGGNVPRVAGVSTTYPGVDPAYVWDHHDPFARDNARKYGRWYLGGSPDEFPARYAAVTSARHINAKAPPTLIILGDNDHLVEPEPTVRFAEQARAAGVNVRLVRFPHGDHVFNYLFRSIGNQANLQITHTFLTAHGHLP
jgi:acetyl esterase/lipase